MPFMMIPMKEVLSDILTHFLVSLSLGTALYTWITDPKLTGAGFVRLIVGHGFIFFALAAGISLWFWGTPSAGAITVAVTILLILGAQWRFHPDRRTLPMWILFGVQVFLTIAIYQVFSSLGDAFILKRFVFLLSSAVLLGITHYAMLLGHYYLVVPKLTERPLLVSLGVFWCALSIKMVLSLISTWQATAYLTEGTMLGDGYMFNWLIVSMRWLWGYGALLVLSYFAWRLCRMRSIQSATGVLYIMVFFVFIGELLSAYLFFKHGLSI